MKCSSIFTYCGIERKNGGECDIDGKHIKYGPKVVVKLDEEKDGNTYHREIKVLEDNPIIPVILKISKYQKVNCVFDVNFYGRNLGIELLEISPITK